VDALPSPEISGEDLVCDFQVEIYETEDHEGSIYLWEATGGTITMGDSTNSATVEWGEVGNGTLTVTEITPNGCEGTSETFEVVIDGCTAINEDMAENSIHIYPNPATDHISVKSAQKVLSLDIYSMNGELVLSQTSISTNSPINTGNLQAGMYLLRIVTESTSETKRLIIK
jgi:hypothetical protein